MTKLFGEYLVEKGHINKSTLLNALVQQIKSVPSVTEIVFEKNLMDHDNILKALLIQHQKQNSFIDAARELNLWNENIQKEVERHITHTKTPLGEILVKTGVVSLDVIADALDVFLTETKFSQEPPKSEVVPIVQNTDSQNTPTGSVEYTTYFDQFTLETYLELKILLTFSHHQPLTQNVIARAIDTLQVYKGTARFVTLPKSELIIDNMLKVLFDMQNKEVEKVDSKEITKLEEYELFTLEVLWQIREELENKKFEDQIISEFSLNPKIEQISAGVSL
jgi:hypothetical protein